MAGMALLKEEGPPDLQLKKGNSSKYAREMVEEEYHYCSECIM